MNTLEDLMNKFASADADDDNQAGGDFVPDTNFAVEDGATKIASGGDTMDTLQDIYMGLAAQDMNKEAHVAADAPYYEEEYVDDDQDLDFAKMAEALAGAEADEYIEQEEYQEQPDIIKVASEYDAAGRIMARGFYDEFNKLAGNMDTDVTPNQNTENPSAASTPALGDRGMVTVPTNYAGSQNNDQIIETAGQSGKEVYKDVLKPAKTISAGQGTGDDPEAMATSLGGGSPAGSFATVRDLANGGVA